MKNHHFYQPLAVILLLVASVNGQAEDPPFTVHPFKVGIGVDANDNKTAVCTAGEMEFMTRTLEKYVVGLTKLFFRDQTIELSETLHEIGSEHFSTSAFEDFNAYEVDKFAGATGQIVDTTGTLSPSTAPTADPEITSNLRSNAVNTPAPVTAAPITSAAVAAVDEECGQCSPAAGQNQPECNVQTKDVCIRMMNQEQKCFWNPCNVWDNWVLSIDNRCGKTEAHARGNCGSICDGITTGCAEGEVCWGVQANYCGSKPQPTECLSEPSDSVSRCGESELIARETCGLSCTADTECAGGESCYPVLANFCDCTDFGTPVATPIAPVAPFAPVAPVVAFAPVSADPACEENCINLDFSTYPDGTAVPRGAYVSDEWEAALGVRITVEAAPNSGYTPVKPGTNYKQARIFDTSNPGTDWNGDEDLGSPNKYCPGGGKGKGAGGKPGKPGENCVPLGNALIIQESDKDTPDDSQEGGIFTFVFLQAVTFQSIGFLDLDPTGVDIHIHTDDGSFQDVHTMLDLPGFGKNAAQDIQVPYSHVKKIVVDMPATVAITHLNYCLSDCASDIRRLEENDKKEDATNNAKIDVEPHGSNGNRELRGWYSFVYGGRSAVVCRQCYSDSIDGRRLGSSYLISALETVVSFGLTADTSWQYKDFLEQQNQPFGCLGDGNSLRVVFELPVAAD